MNRFFACVALLAATGSLSFAEKAPESDEKEKANASSLAVGKELFHREWLPNDPRAHGGDGLGPVFNESSCVACHNQGGAGGAGAASNNVAILTITRSFLQGSRLSDDQRKAIEKEFKSLALATGIDVDGAKATSASRVIHRFGLSEKHASWRGNFLAAAISNAQQIQAELPIVQTVPQSVPPQVVTGGGVTRVEFEQMHQTRFTEADSLLNRFATRIALLQGSTTVPRSTNGHGHHIINTSQRNTTALFGAGLIDSITDKQIEAAAEKKYSEFPRVSGRVSRTETGIGRFGWKANTTSLKAFTMAACAVELGLQVPGQSQSSVAYDRNYKPAGLDLNETELDALTDYIGALPKPVERMPADKIAAELIQEGREVFSSIGCATCHSPKLGNVEGIYSDLLLHDLGPALSDVGTSYGQSIPGALPLSDAKDEAGRKKLVLATASEWKTPPLWGCRDSGPYLHDGRADSLEQAIALHDGEAQDSTMQFLMLTPKKRQLLVAFLKTLRAPQQ